MRARIAWSVAASVAARSTCRVARPGPTRSMTIVTVRVVWVPISNGCKPESVASTLRIHA